MAFSLEEKWDWDSIIKIGKDCDFDCIEEPPIDMNYCSCGFEFTNMQNVLKCVKCGIERNIEGSYNDGYSVIENPFMNTVTIGGVGSKVYRSNVYKSGHFSENDLRIKRNLIYEELVKLYDTFKLTNNQSKLNITKNHLKSTARLYSLMISPSNNKIINNTDTYGFTDEADIIRYREYVLRIKTEIYKDEKKRIILRSTNKKEALAALLSHVLLSEGITCSKSAIPAMLQLGQDGCAAGEAQIMKRSHILNMDIDINTDRIGPEVDTLFNNIRQKYFTVTENLECEFNNLKLAIYEIHAIFEDKFIADRSCPKSQIIGATYVIMRRCKNKKLIPNVPTIIVYCNELIRKPTVEKLIIEMNKFHSNFVDVYKKYNLDDTRWKTL
jgi:hypothetical protein